MNTNVSDSATPNTALPDRVALRARLEETRLAFHSLVESLTDEKRHSIAGTTRTDSKPA